MLLITEIIPHVKACLDQISRLSFIPLEFPYKLKCHCPNNSEGSTSYEFEASTKFTTSHWIYHLIIMSSCVISMLYQCIFEDTVLMEFAIHTFFLAAFSKDVIALCTQHRHSRTFASFLNQLLSFETRWLNTSSENERRYWPQAKYRDKLVAGFRMNRTSVPFLCLADAISVAIRPLSPWRMVPAIVLEKISQINLVGNGSWIISEILQRSISFIYTYVAFYLCINEYLIATVLSYFSAQCSMVYMIIALKRMLNGDSSHFSFKERGKLDTIVGMYRETQLFCSYYNRIHKICFNPPLIIIGITGTAVSLFMLVSYGGNLDAKSALMLGDLLVVCVGHIMLTFDFGVKLYIESSDLLTSKAYARNCGKSTFLQSPKDRIAVRRYWRSFPILKTYFFQSNFFESTTPLVLLNFAMGLAINLILLEQGNN